MTNEDAIVTFRPIYPVIEFAVLASFDLVRDRHPGGWLEEMTGEERAGLHKSAIRMLLKQASEETGGRLTLSCGDSTPDLLICDDGQRRAALRVSKAKRGDVTVQRNRTEQASLLQECGTTAPLLIPGCELDSDLSVFTAVFVLHNDFPEVGTLQARVGRIFLGRESSRRSGPIDEIWRAESLPAVTARRDPPSLPEVRAKEKAAELGRRLRRLA